MDQGSNENHYCAYNFAPTVTKFCVMWEGLSLPHDTKFGNCRCEIVDSRAFPSWSLIHGLRWSGLIKAEPGKISLYWIGGLMSFPRLDIPVRSEKRQLSIIDTILCILYCPNDTICIFFSPWCMSEGHRPVCVQIIWQLRGPNQALSGIGHSRGLLQYPRRYFILWFYCVSKPENWAFQYSSHKLRYASDKYITRHHFVTEMGTHNAPFCNRNVYTSVTKWCLVGYGTGALWDFFLYWCVSSEYWYCP